MGLKNSMFKIAGQGGDAIKMMAKEFNNLEDQIIRVQKNQVEFEKYLTEILELCKKNQKKE